jgi:AraC-like DNA-binding protein
LRSSDVDEVRYALSRAFCENQLRLNGHSDAFEMRLNVAPLRRVSLVYGAYGTEVEIDPQCPRDIYVVEIPLAGVAVYQREGGSVAADKTKAFICSPTDHLRIRARDDAEVLSVKIPSVVLERVAGQWVGALPRPLVFAPSLDLRSRRAQPFVDLVKYLVTELERGWHPADSPLAAISLEEALVNSLLEAQPHTYSDELHGQTNRLPSDVVRRVEDYVEAHAEQPVDIGSLVEQVGVRKTALYDAFRRQRGYTPHQFLRRVRLQRTRRELLRALPATSVTKVALDAGFVHLGRFSAQYAAEFGELPSETLRKARRRG